MNQADFRLRMVQACILVGPLSNKFQVAQVLINFESTISSHDASTLLFDFLRVQSLAIGYAGLVGPFVTLCEFPSSGELWSARVDPFSRPLSRNNPSPTSIPPLSYSIASFESEQLKGLSAHSIGCPSLLGSRAETCINNRTIHEHPRPQFYSVPRT